MSRGRCPMRDLDRVQTLGAAVVLCTAPWGDSFEMSPRPKGSSLLSWRAYFASGGRDWGTSCERMGLENSRWRQRTFGVYYTLTRLGGGAFEWPPRSCKFNRRVVDGVVEQERTRKDSSNCEMREERRGDIHTWWSSGSLASALFLVDV